MAGEGDRPGCAGYARVSSAGTVRPAAGVPVTTMERLGLVHQGDEPGRFWWQSCVGRSDLR